MANAVSNTERNYSVDIFRMIFAYMVVAIHAHPLADINGILGYLAVQTLPRIAVPFFFCVSGYYYIKGLLAKKASLKKTIGKLLIVYTLWSVIYLSADFLLIVVKHHRPISVFAWHVLLRFFVYGSNYHLWFFPTLFFCLFAATLFDRMRMLGFLAFLSIPFSIVGLLDCSYNSLGTHIPVLKNLIGLPYFPAIRQFLSQGLPAFMLGYFLHVWRDRYSGIPNGALFSGWTVAFALFLAEIFSVVHFHLQTDLAVTVFLYPLLAITMMLLLNNPLPGRGNTAHYTRGIANFTYYSHPLAIMALGIAWNGISPVRMTETPLFLMTLALTTLAGWVLIRVDNRWLNKSFM